jgi:hypothetical protein
VMPVHGSKSFRASQGSISRARNTVDRTTGRSGSGTASGPAPTSAPRRDRRRARRRLGRDLRGRQLHRTEPDNARLGQVGKVAEALRPTLPRAAEALHPAVARRTLTRSESAQPERWWPQTHE